MALGIALAFARDPGGCGGDDTPGGPNAPCTRPKDCANGLVCSEGVCTAPDSGVAAGDSGSDAGTAADATSD